MKVKMMQHNGATVLVVSGAQQQLIINEEGGGFAIELLQKACNNAVPAAPMFVPESVQEEVQENVQEQERKAVAKLQAIQEAALQENAPEAAQKPVLNEDVYKELVLLRKKLAMDDNVPPYLVFHDKTLREMADKMPANMQDMGNISGVGQAKLDKFGPAFLSIINSFAPRA